MIYGVPLGSRGVCCPPPLLLRKTLRICANLTTHPNRGRWARAHPCSTVATPLAVEFIRMRRRGGSLLSTIALYCRRVSTGLRWRDGRVDPVDGRCSGRPLRGHTAPTETRPLRHQTTRGALWLSRVCTRWDDTAGLSVCLSVSLSVCLCTARARFGSVQTVWPNSRGVFQC